jgi:hypothetical protein
VRRGRSRSCETGAFAAPVAAAFAIPRGGPPGKAEKEALSLKVYVPVVQAV